MNFPVLDLHCDTALALWNKDFSSIGDLRQNNGHIDLERAGTLDGYAQCFACFTTPEMEQWYGKSPVSVFEWELAGILSQIEKNKDKISLAYCAEDLQCNLQDGKASAVLTMEGTAGISYDPALLEDLYKIGFRMTTLGWNERNPLTGSHMTGEGLSDRGREYVRQAQDVGMLVDVSHISDKGFWDIINMTRAQIVASHSNSRAVHPASRNLTDDMFLAICQTGGVVGLNLYADFIGQEPCIDTAADHVLHFMDLDPSGKHIALGGDLDGCEKLPNGFSGISDYPLLAQTLLRRGLTHETVQDIFWNNALGVIKHAVPRNKK